MIGFDTVRPRSRRRAGRLVGAAMALLFVVAIQTASAESTAAIDAGTAAGLCSTAYQPSGGTEPLAACQWDMGVIHATTAHATATGAGVKVGVIDGGVDFTHPDLTGAIDVPLSCSFIYSTTPTADPQEIANGDCSKKSAVQDLQGHGTHVSTTIAGRLNGIGIEGVAPGATIVGLKACTIVGFCFADSVAAALRYAGDQRLDVVNLSLFADPYLYFCANEAGQRAILRDLADAARYAQQRGVVIVAAGRERGAGPRSSDDRRDQSRLAAGHRDRARGSQQLPGRTGGAARRRHRLGERGQHPRELLERRLADRRHRPGRGRSADARHGLWSWAHPRRVVEHGRDRHLGGSLQRQPGRPDGRRSIRLDQRNLDGLAARRRRRGADSPGPPGHAAGSRCSAAALVGDAPVLPGELAGRRSAPVHRRVGPDVLLRRRDGERRGRSDALTPRQAAERRRGERTSALPFATARVRARVGCL